MSEVTNVKRSSTVVKEIFPVRRSGRSRKRKSPVQTRELSPEIKVHRSSRASLSNNEPKASSSQRKPQVKQQDLRNFISIEEGSSGNSAKLSKELHGTEKHPELAEFPVGEDDIEVSLSDAGGNSDDDEEPNSASPNNNSEVSKRQNSVLVKLPVFSIPTWLKKYYDYDGHVDAKSGNLVMTCKLCKAENENNSLNKKVQFRGCGIYNFTRHIQLCHAMEYDQEKKDGKVPMMNNKPKVSRTNVGTKSAVDAWSSLSIPQSNIGAYHKNHPVQRRFLRDFMDCVSIDQLPLSFIERPTFRKLVRNLNKDVRLISRRTIGRQFQKIHCTEFKRKMKALLTDLGDSTCHILLDMWTDRQKSSMLGVRVQFVGNDWKMHNLTLAFQHFSQSHMSRAIRQAVVDILHGFKISPEKIGFVIGDNASNVNAAFDSSSVEDSIPYGFQGTDSGDFSDDEEENEEWETFDEFFNEDCIDYCDVEKDETMSVFRSSLEEWTRKKLPKLPCYCHLLQLGLRDALLKNQAISDLINDIRVVIKFFRSSTTWYDKLKKLAGKALVSQAQTRWNSVCQVLERLTEEKVRIALKTVLEETRNTTNPCKVMFSVGDFEKMAVIVELLHPILEATDVLQADNVTSSAVIPSISCAFKAIKEVDVGSDQDLKEVQQSLLNSLIERYRPSQALDQSRLNRIVTDEIFGNKTLILATVLNPIFKLTPFMDMEDELNAGLISMEDVTRILEKAVEDISEAPVVAHSVPTASIANKETGKRSIFRHLEPARSQAAQQSSSDKSEVKKYLELPIENSTTDPLLFWKSNTSSFPKLASLARIYLGIPASSGSVERMFSIAGALQRSRRASLSWTMIEQLLCDREMRMVQLFGKK